MSELTRSRTYSCTTSVPARAPLFCTTAQAGMTATAIAACPDAGKVFVAMGIAKGLPEPQVTL